MTPVPRDPAYEARVRASFAKQAFMSTIGAELSLVKPGEVVIHLPSRPDLTQQHGFLHAGVTAAVVDSACGYAALTLMPPDAAVLSVEFKINMLAPAAGSRFRATGRVVKSGRTLTICTGELRAEGTDADASDAGSLVAVMQATMIAVRGREGVAE